MIVFWKNAKANFAKPLMIAWKNVLTKKKSLKFHTLLFHISIEKNKNIFTKSLIELYQEFNLPPINIDEFINEGKCTKGKENYFRYLLVTNISELYNLYTQSKRYKREVEIIKNNSGLKMMLLYKFVSENFIKYYLYTKPHFCKKQSLKIKK